MAVTKLQVNTILAMEYKGIRTQAENTMDKMISILIKTKSDFVLHRWSGTNVLFQHAVDEIIDQAIRLKSLEHKEREINLIQDKFGDSIR